MERKRIILIGVAAAVVLVGLIVAMGMRKPKGPDCAPIAKAQLHKGRPVVALAPLLGDDPASGSAALVEKTISELVDVARVSSPLTSFSGSSVPDAVRKAEADSQFWLKCGASAVIWGSVEHEGDVVIDDKKSKKPVTKPVYAILLWVTTGPESTIQIPRTRDGREAGEAAFRAWSEKSRLQSEAKKAKLNEPSAPPQALEPGLVAKPPVQGKP